MPAPFSIQLPDHVALVAGASRGLGRGIALALAQAGAHVYATGRTISATSFPPTDRIIPLPCDHTRDAAVAAVFERVLADHGRLDILVNSVWGGYENMAEDGVFTWNLPFWQQPVWRWDAMFNAGVRAAYVSSCLAARQMIARRRGLIVNLSFWAAQRYLANVPYGASKAATDKLTADMAHELRDHGVAVVALYPGLVRTERVLEAAAYFDLSNSESAEFSGRAVAALAADPHLMARSGRVLLSAALALEYGFTDVDGRQPQPLTADHF